MASKGSVSLRFSIPRVPSPCPGGFHAAFRRQSFDDVQRTFFLDRFGAAAGQGFEAVEFLFPYEHSPDAIAARLREHRLTLALFNLSPGDFMAGERGLAALPERRGEFEASVDIALRYARTTGAKTLHVMAGNAPSGAAVHEAAYEDALRFACEQAAGDNVTIVIERINRRDMPAYFLNDFEQAAALIRRLALPNLKLQFDIYHRQILHGDVVRGLEAMADIIGHVQVASVPERHEPFTGELDDGRVFDAVDRIGYRGFIGCEYQPAAATIAGLGWFAPFRS